MKNILHSAWILLPLLLLIPQNSFAATLLIGDKINIEADEVIEGDYYVSVGSIGTTVMSGEVQGDMYAIAGNVTANGVIDGDFGSIGGLAFMHASVTDDVRIVAGEAIIDHDVGGDVVVIAGMLKVLSTAKIAGDVIFYGVEGEINGSVGGSIYGTSDQLRIDAPIGGDVNVKAGNELTLGSKAAVEGNVTYTSTNDIVRAQESTVEGEVTKKTPPSISAAQAWKNLLIPLFISLFATLTLYILFKKEMERVITAIVRSPLPAGAVGLATLIAGPFIALLLIITGLGMLLGIFAVGALLILAASGFSLAIVLTGALIAKAVTGQQSISLVWILLGALVFHAAIMVPVIGPTLALVMVAMAVGAMLLVLYRSLT